MLLFPLKLLALWLIGQGQTGLGIAIIVAAKLLGTALVGRLFVLVEPQLMTFAWFARALSWWRDDQGEDRRAGAPLGAVAGGRGRCAGCWLARARRAMR